MVFARYNVSYNANYNFNNNISVFSLLQFLYSGFNINNNGVVFFSSAETYENCRRYYERGSKAQSNY